MSVGGRGGVRAARWTAPPAGHEGRSGLDAGLGPRRQRATPLAALRLAREQLRHGWPLLLITALGLFVAVTVACTAPLFGTLVADAQLRVAVDANGPPGRNVEVDVGTPGISPDDLRQQDAAVRSLAGPALAGFAGAPATTFIQVTPLRLLRVGARQVNLPGGDIIQVGFLAYDYAQAGPHMRLSAGRLPAAAPGQMPEAVVTAQMAAQRGIHVGDTLVTYAPLPDGTAGQIAVRVVGIWQPLRPDEDFWNGRSFVAVPVGQDVQTWTYPVLLAPTDLAAALAPFRRVGVDQGWIYYTETARITGASAGAVVAQVQRLRLRLSLDQGISTSAQASVRLFTGLDTAIPAAQRQLALLAQPLAMLALLVAGLALLFVAALAGLLAEAQAPEIATLRSRGASVAQVLGGYALLGVVAAAVAGLAGPPEGTWLAATLLRRIAGGAAGAPAPYADVAGQVAAVAALAAALGAGAVVAATWQAARRDVVAWRRAEGRAARRPIWQRYYLDLALAALCVAGYVDLATFGGLGARERLRQGGGSPLLAAVPALLVLAAALVALARLLADRPTGGGPGGARARRRGHAGVGAGESRRRRPGAHRPAAADGSGDRALRARLPRLAGRQRHRPRGLRRRRRPAHRAGRAPDGQRRGAHPAWPGRTRRRRGRHAGLSRRRGDVAGTGGQRGHRPGDRPGDLAWRGRAYFVAGG
jgi:putative ABC transport system permease protein